MINNIIYICVYVYVVQIEQIYPVLIIATHFKGDIDAKFIMMISCIRNGRRICSSNLLSQMTIFLTTRHTSLRPDLYMNTTCN